MAFTSSSFQEFAVNTANISRTSANNVTVTLPFIPVGIELLEAEIPLSYYTINSTNNKIYFTVAAVDYTATVTAGNYDISTIGAVIKSVMESATAALYVFTVTGNVNTNKLTISCTTALLAPQVFQLTFVGKTDSFGLWAGFSLTANKTGSSTYTGDYTVNMTGPNFIFLTNSLITGTTGITSYLTTDTNIQERFQVSVNPGSVLIYTSVPGTHVLPLLNDATTTMQLQLTFENQTAIDFNGQPASYLFALYRR